MSHDCPNFNSRTPHVSSQGFFSVSTVVALFLTGGGKIGGLRAWAGLALTGGGHNK